MQYYFPLLDFWPVKTRLYQYVLANIFSVSIITRFLRVMNHFWLFWDNTEDDGKWVRFVICQVLSFFFLCYVDNDGYPGSKNQHYWQSVATHRCLWCLGSLRMIVIFSALQIRPPACYFCTRLKTVPLWWTENMYFFKWTCFIYVWATEFIATIVCYTVSLGKPKDMKKMASLNTL